MAYAYADIPAGVAVSPFIGGAMTGSQPRMAGQRSPESTIFASAAGIGGTSVMGANAPTRQEPGRNDRMDVPTMNHAVNAAGENIGEGVKNAGNGIGGMIDGAADFGIKAAAVTSAMGQVGLASLQNAVTTQGASYSWPQAPEPSVNSGQNSALMEAMHWATVAKTQGMEFSGGFSTADLGDLRNIATNPEAQQFAQLKSEQSAGMVMA